MCLYPKLIKNRKYTSNKKNGGNIPAISDERVKYVPVGCGNCIECRKQYSRNWQLRLFEDIKKHKNGKFVTLTFSDSSIKELNDCIDNKTGYDLDNQIATLGVRRFLERYRKIYKISLRHWLVTEIGHNGTENIHLHGIIWTDKNLDEIEKIWKYGIMWKGKGEKRVNYVNNQTINYIVKYITKIDEKNKYFKSKVLTSPGIGSHYMERNDWKKNKYNGNKTNETYRLPDGKKISMPIYWRNKIYSEEEREKLWLQKLDKNERWVCGEKVDVSKNNDNYFNLLNYYRKINKELGYGDDVKDWNEYHYKQELRNLKIMKRIEKNKNTN